MRAHLASAKRDGLTLEQINALREPSGRHQPRFEEIECAVLRYTDLLTTGPGNIDETDLDALHRYFDDGQIVELDLVISFANLTNRISEGLLASRR